MTRPSCDVRAEELVWMSEATRDRLWDKEDPRVVSVVVNATRASSVRWADEEEEEEDGGREVIVGVVVVVMIAVVVVGLGTTAVGEEDVVMMDLMMIDWSPEDEGNISERFNWMGGRSMRVIG